MATIAQHIKTKIESQDIKNYSLYANAYLIERQGDLIYRPLSQANGVLEFKKVDDQGKMIYLRMIYPDGSRLEEEWHQATKKYQLTASAPATV